MEIHTKMSIGKLILVTGCFNGLTPDHIKLFNYASTFDLPITAGLNGNRYCQKKNGPRAIPAVDREYLLRGVKYVQDVLIFEEDDPSELILRIRPVHYVKGPDYRDVVLPEQAACELVGTRIVFRPGEYIYASREVFKPAAVGQ